MAGAPNPNLSVEAFKELVTGLLTAFPDFHVTVEDQMVSGNKAAFRWIAKSTHNGPLGEAQATGKKVQFEGLIFDHKDGEQVVERCDQWDQMGMLQQLGLV
jgi:predicted ester cyclase